MSGGTRKLRVPWSLAAGLFTGGWEVEKSTEPIKDLVVLEVRHSTEQQQVVEFLMRSSSFADNGRNTWATAEVWAPTFRKADR